VLALPMCLNVDEHGDGNVAMYSWGLASQCLLILDVCDLVGVGVAVAGKAKVGPQHDDDGGDHHSIHASSV